jgi:hypothetical protein
LLIMVIHGGQRDLLQIVDALCPPSRLARGLHGRQQRDDQTAMMAITTSSSIEVKPRPIS